VKAKKRDSAEAKQREAKKREAKKREGAAKRMG